MDKEQTAQQDLLQAIAAQRDAALNASAVMQVRLNTALRDLEDHKKPKEKTDARAAFNKK